MLYKVIDRWAYRNDTFCAECYVTAETNGSHELVYKVRTDRTPLDGKASEVQMPWFTVDTYTSWGELVNVCPPAVVSEGVYGTSLIGRGELTERDVWLMVGHVVKQEQESRHDVSAWREAMRDLKED